MYIEQETTEIIFKFIKYFQFTFEIFPPRNQIDLGRRYGQFRFSVLTNPKNNFN